VLATFAVGAVIYIASPVFIPVVLSVLLFYGLDPVVDAIERRRVPRALASAFTVFALVGLIGAGGMLLWPQLDAVLTDVPEGAQRFRSEFRASTDDTFLEKLQRATQAIDTAAAETAPAPAEPGVVRVQVQQPWRPSDWIWAQGYAMLGLAGQALTVLFLTIFLLNEDDAFKRKLVRQMETLGSKRVSVQILNDIARQIHRFIWVQAVTSFAVAVVTGVALWWVGLEQPAVWGLFAGVMNIVPYFGPLIVTGVLTIVGFLQVGTLSYAMLVAGLSLAITTFEGMFLTPHLLSRSAALNHVAIFLAIAFWSWAWGFAGILLAVPILMTVKAVCDHVEGLQWLGDFLGEEKTTG
jgi:predicted PurR-regulated permease PerM